MPAKSKAFQSRFSAFARECQIRRNRDEAKQLRNCSVPHIQSLRLFVDGTASRKLSFLSLFSKSATVRPTRRTRTAPLWGVGQRLFFLHDGRTNDLIVAIRAHGGEATQVIQNFNGSSTLNPVNNLTAAERQNFVNFLRSL